MFKFKGGVQDLVDNELFLLIDGKDGEYIPYNKFIDESGKVVLSEVGCKASHKEVFVAIQEILENYLKEDNSDYVEVGGCYVETAPVINIVKMAVVLGLEDNFLDANLTYYGE